MCFRIFENRKNELLCLLLGYLITLTSFDLVKVLGVFFIQLQHNFNASASEVSFTIGLSSAMVFLGGNELVVVFYVITLHLSTEDYDLPSCIRTEVT